MRDIRFRGINLHGKWVFGSYLRLNYHDSINYVDLHQIVTYNGHTYDVIPETVGQWAGFADKNGIAVYEHDIIQDDGGLPKGIKYKGIVRYGGFTKAPCAFWSDTSVFGTPNGLPISEFVEVIGDVHSTAELITG